MRLCDDVLSDPKLRTTSAQKWDDDRKVTRAWWRQTLIECERFDLTDLCRLFEVGQLQYAPEEILPQNLPSLKLPYQPCWVEMRWNNPADGHQDAVGAAFFEPGRAALEEPESLVAYTAFSTNGHCLVGNHASLQYRSNGLSHQIVEPWTWSRPLSEDATEDHRAWGINFLLYGLSLLHCRNVGSELIQPNRAERRRAEREKRPVFSYRELTVRIGGKMRRLGTIASGNHRDLPLHRVRAHFKHFTEERPAFGWLTGPVWCPPFLRGDRRFGEHEKDYRLA